MIQFLFELFALSPNIFEKKLFKEMTLSSEEVEEIIELVKRVKKKKSIQLLSTIIKIFHYSIETSTK